MTANSATKPLTNAFCSGVSLSWACLDKPFPLADAGKHCADCKSTVIGLSLFGRLRFLCLAPVVCLPLLVVPNLVVSICLLDSASVFKASFSKCTSFSPPPSSLPAGLMQPSQMTSLIAQHEVAASVRQSQVRSCAELALAVSDSMASPQAELAKVTLKTLVMSYMDCAHDEMFIVRSVLLAQKPKGCPSGDFQRLRSHQLQHSAPQLLASGLPPRPCYPLEC
mmetsp:Transcript_64420/g.153679  ORF Transcript_64420/g.153679 Transcript_64420/m.153679 type:complete len:223 (+) Transcript_64420:999-1667(+)